MCYMYLSQATHLRLFKLGEKSSIQVSKIRRTRPDGTSLFGALQAFDFENTIAS